MRLCFKQRMFSWFDSYDIYDEYGNTVFEVKGQLSWGHLFKIMDSYGNELGSVRQVILTLLPKFEIIMNGQSLGFIRKELTLFRPKYDFDFTGWHVEGSIFEWNYTIVDNAGRIVAEISKEFFHLTDTYIIDVRNDEDALLALMFVLAIDAEKCSRDNN